MKLKPFVKTSIIAIAFLCLSPLVKAGPGDPGPDPDPQPPVGPVGVPLDGGLSILIAAGVGYAAKRGYDKRMKEKMVGDIEK